MSKTICNTGFQQAKKDALREAKRLCKGKPDRVRHQMFVQLWEQNLNKVVKEMV